MSRRRRQSGLSYVEVLVATLVLAGGLVPALQALHGAARSAAVIDEAGSARRQQIARLETVLAEPFANLVAAAGQANGHDVPTSYSDAPGSDPRQLVYLGVYDIANLDSDGDPFTLADPNGDGDNNPFTGGEVAIDLLWVGVATEGRGGLLATLTGSH